LKFWIKNRYLKTRFYF